MDTLVTPLLPPHLFLIFNVTNADMSLQKYGNKNCLQV